MYSTAITPMTTDRFDIAIQAIQLCTPRPPTYINWEAMFDLRDLPSDDRFGAVCNKIGRSLRAPELSARRGGRLCRVQYRALCCAAPSASSLDNTVHTGIGTSSIRPRPRPRRRSPRPRPRRSSSQPPRPRVQPSRRPAGPRPRRPPGPPARPLRRP